MIKKKKSRSDYKYKGYTSPNKGTLQHANSQHQHRWRETKKKKNLQMSQKYKVVYSLHT